MAMNRRQTLLASFSGLGIFVPTIPKAAEAPKPKDLMEIFKDIKATGDLMLTHRTRDMETKHGPDSRYNDELKDLTLDLSTMIGEKLEQDITGSFVYVQHKKPKIYWSGDVGPMQMGVLFELHTNEILNGYTRRT